MKTGRQDVYQRVTNQIIEAIERGAEDWKMPWHQTAGETLVPINAQSKKPYRGVNILSLWAAAEERGYNTNLWATYKQWQELGANVRKAEKATLVVFWKFSDLGINEGSKEEEREEESRRSVLAVAIRSLTRTRWTDSPRPRCRPFPKLKGSRRRRISFQLWVQISAMVAIGLATAPGLTTFRCHALRSFKLR
jgi:hypothetical protein